MADNVAVTAGTGTSIAADEVVDGTLGTVKVQFVKLMDGTLDGTAKAKILAASTAPVATDPALVVAISPNSVNANGQATMANSAPVVLASNQSAVPVTVPVGNANSAASGSVSIASDDAIIGIKTETAPATDTASSGMNGRLQRVAQRLTSMIALLPTAIGPQAKAAALAVTVATDQPTVAMAQDTANIANGVTGTNLTPKFKIVTASSSGATTIVAAVTSKKIRVLAWDVKVNAAVNFKWQSHVTPTDLTGLYYNAGQGDGVARAFNPVGYFETVAGEALDINLSGNVAVGGVLTYVEV